MLACSDTHILPRTDDESHIYTVRTHVHNFTLFWQKVDSKPWAVNKMGKIKKCVCRGARVWGGGLIGDCVMWTSI